MARKTDASEGASNPMELLVAYIQAKLDRDKPVYFPVVCYKSKYAKEGDLVNNAINFRKPFKTMREARKFALSEIKRQQNSNEYIPEAELTMSQITEYLVYSAQTLKAENYEVAMQLRDNNFNGLRVMNVAGEDMTNLFTEARK